MIDLWLILIAASAALVFVVEKLIRHNVENEKSKKNWYL